MKRLWLSEHEFDVLVTAVEEAIRFNEEYGTIDDGLINEAKIIIKKLQEQDTDKDIESKAEDTLQILKKIIEEREAFNYIQLTGFRTINSGTFYKMMYERKSDIEYDRKNGKDVRHRIEEHNEIIHEALGPFQLLIE